MDLTASPRPSAESSADFGMAGIASEPAPEPAVDFDLVAPPSRPPEPSIAIDSDARIGAPGPIATEPDCRVQSIAALETRTPVQSAEELAERERPRPRRWRLSRRSSSGWTPSMSHAPSAALDRRHRTIRDDLVARGLDALVVTSLPNILYLTNFTGSSAIVVLTADRAATSSPTSATSRRSTTARGTAQRVPRPRARHRRRFVRRDARRRCSRSRGWRARRLRGGAPDGQPPHMADGDARRVAAPAAALVATEGIVERARVRKDAYEIATLREAARRLSAVAGDGARRDVRRGRDRAGGRAGHRLAASARPGSSGRRLIRSWPAARTPPCRTPGPASEN